MSKKKKSIEELLEEALVPEEEQIYEVPENWVWVKLGDNYAICLDKYRKPINAKERAVRGGDIPYYGATGQVGWIDDFLTNEELVILGEDGAPFLDPFKNKAYMIRGKAWVNNHAHILKSHFGSNGHRFLLHYLNQFNFRDYVSGTTRLKLTQKQMNNIPIPLPPLNEQKRIAQKVDYLLSKIEKAKQLIEEAKERFDLRRAAILDKAFRGELTTKWREANNSEDILNYITTLKTITKLKENGILEPYTLPAGWRWARIGDLFHVQVGSTPSRKNALYWEGGFPWLSSGEVQFNTINESREYVTDLAVEECRLKLAPKGSILFGMIGEGKTRGQVALLNLDAFHNQNIASIWVSNTKISSLYVYYWLLSQYSKNRQNSAGNNQPAYNKSRVQELLIPIAPISEIEVIVNQLQRLLELENNTNKLLSLEETLNDIKQSILSKAFKGELGTNNPSEESAIELLKEVLKEQAN